MRSQKAGRSSMVLQLSTAHRNWYKLQGLGILPDSQWFEFKSSFLLSSVYTSISRTHGGKISIQNIYDDIKAYFNAGYYISE